MPLILYSLDMSPPVRAVKITARALGVDLELREVDVRKGAHLKPEYTKINPQHTIPTLDDDGFIIWDSHAIAAYLVGKYGKEDSLYPKDLQKRAIVDQRLHFDSGILFPRLREIFFPIWFRKEKVIPQDKIDGMLKGYNFVEKFLEGHDWLAGDQMTIADICAGTNVSSVEIVIPIDPEKFPNITAWLKRLYDNSSFREVNQETLEQIKVTIAKIMS